MANVDPPFFTNKLVSTLFELNHHERQTIEKAIQGYYMEGYPRWLAYREYLSELGKKLRRGET